MTTDSDKDSSAIASDSCPIAAIGASAGGIAALQRFFPAVPADSGMAYVVIQHLDAEHDSVLASIIQRCTSIETETAVEASDIEPNKVYVIPPGVSVTVKDGRFHLSKMTSARSRRTPIDDFFISLAEDQGEKAAAIILSGTGSDGTIGLRAIKEHGGLTLAQESAEYDGMMRSAVQTGLVDMVQPVEEMAATLIDYFRRAGRVANGERDRRKRDISDQLSRIASLLRARTGHDFSGYKDNTILRRIQRRMQVLQIDDPVAFYERLREEPQQVDLLFQDLLIGVTDLKLRAALDPFSEQRTDAGAVTDAGLENNPPVKIPTDDEYASLRLADRLGQCCEIVASINQHGDALGALDAPAIAPRAEKGWVHGVARSGNAGARHGFRVPG